MDSGKGAHRIFLDFSEWKVFRQLIDFFYIYGIASKLIGHGSSLIGFFRAW